jgi:hypothetical protein
VTEPDKKRTRVKIGSIPLAATGDEIQARRPLGKTAGANLRTWQEVCLTFSNASGSVTLDVGRLGSSWAMGSLVMVFGGATRTKSLVQLGRRGGTGKTTMTTAGKTAG